MPSRVLSLGLAAVLAASVFAGCGDDSDSDSSAAKPAATATVPAGNLAASTAPPKLGLYGGIECGSNIEACIAFEAQAKEGYTAYCKGEAGKPNPTFAPDYTFQGKTYNFVCFRLKTARDLVDVYLAEARIVGNVYVSADRFPSTCDAGYCISGEWTSTRLLDGKIVNPNKVSSFYKAQWIAD